MSFFHSLLSSGAIDFPDSLMSGLEIWHTLSDQGGVQGATITSVTDLSGNVRTGTASGGQRTLNIENNGLKSLSSNGTNDIITFSSTGIVARTVAILYKQNTGLDRWGEYYGIVGKTSTGGNEFSIACNATTPTSGETGRQFLRPVGTFTSVQTDNVLPSSFTTGTMNLAGDASLMQEYHLIIFELTADVASDVATWAWLQERSVGGRYLQALFCDGWIWNRVLTTQERIDLYIWATGARKYKQIYSAPNNIILDGNSLTIGATTSFSTAPITQALALLGSGYTGGSCGYGSAITSDLDSRFNNIITLKKRAFSGQNIYLCWEGSNSLANTISVADTFASYTSICDKARNIGFTVIGTTVIDRRGALLIAQPIFDARRASLNTMIRDYHSGLNELVADFANDVNLQDATNTTYFNGDQIHLTSTGNAVVGQIINDTVSLL